MIRAPIYTTILTLHKQRESQKEIAKLTRQDCKTIRRIIFKCNSCGYKILQLKIKILLVPICMVVDLLNYVEKTR